MHYPFSFTNFNQFIVGNSLHFLLIYRKGIVTFLNEQFSQFNRKIFIYLKSDNYPARETIRSCDNSAAYAIAALISTGFNEG